MRFLHKLMISGLVLGGIVGMLFYKASFSKTMSMTNANVAAGAPYSLSHVPDFSVDEIHYFTTGAGSDPKLAERLPLYIRTLMAKPSDKFRKTNPGISDPSVKHESTQLDKIMGGKTNGFFIECGALDGRFQSSSYFLEVARNWTGLLIEGNLGLRPALLNMGRNAYVLNNCLSIQNKPMYTKFTSDFALGGISDNIHNKDRIASNDPRITYTTCFPFNAVFDALGIEKIDLFILDVEGAELNILKTIDFNRIRIDILTVEYGVYKGAPNAAKNRLESYREFFKGVGLYEEILDPDNIFAGLDISSGLDVVFKRKDYKLMNTTVFKTKSL